MNAEIEVVFGAHGSAIDFERVRAPFDVAVGAAKNVGLTPIVIAESGGVVMPLEFYDVDQNRVRPRRLMVFGLWATMPMWRRKHKRLFESLASGDVSANVLENSVEHPEFFRCQLQYVISNGLEIRTEPLSLWSTLYIAQERAVAAVVEHLLAAGLVEDYFEIAKTTFDKLAIANEHRDRRLAAFISKIRSGRQQSVILMCRGTNHIASLPQELTRRGIVARLYWHGEDITSAPRDALYQRVFDEADLGNQIAFERFTTGMVHLPLSDRHRRLLLELQPFHWVRDTLRYCSELKGTTLTISVMNRAAKAITARWSDDELRKFFSLLHYRDEPKLRTKRIRSYIWTWLFSRATAAERQLFSTNSSWRDQ